MGTLKIERIAGGFTGAGAPNSRIKSSGEQAMSALSTDDQATVEALFGNPEGHQGSTQQGNVPRYRITRTVNGKDQTVVVPESAVPSSLQACVIDKLI
jgi:uncharacterized protein YbbC (DUF1343 family)